MSNDNNHQEEDTRPFVAPCHSIAPSAPLRWLRKGWQDFRAAPGPSLIYGFIMVGLSYLITAATWWFGNMGLYLGLISGFVFLGPILALNLYDISIQIQQDQTPTLKESLRQARHCMGDTLTYTVIMIVVFLIWARAANLIYIFYPVNEWHWNDILLFFGVGSSVGAVFCAIIFTASVFSLPMIMDRRTDMVTGVITSINAVLRNKLPLVLWACLIGICLLVGLLTAYLGLAVLLPVLGYATWHGYQEAIDASDWEPRFELPHHPR
ncbi:MAG: DUF2189 domain-containing protein [Alcanivorax sp.]|jgi:uncharacterized membrane protein|uniref:DUF2189 domain-containing protein n=1 Tax=Alcanivorax sp. TaxID=1872427 RepID=UPI002620AAA8|nr:DUF2189 domain-containing protein [Alcanivorax sp.]MDF1724555.1 DUF2189 domain-containing protein [Alcanivorax sp.]